MLSSIFLPSPRARTRISSLCLIAIDDARRQHHTHSIAIVDVAFALNPADHAALMHGGFGETLRQLRYVRVMFLDGLAGLTQGMFSASTTITASSGKKMRVEGGSSVRLGMPRSSKVCAHPRCYYLRYLHRRRDLNQFLL